MRWFFPAPHLAVAAVALLSGCGGSGGTTSTHATTVRIPSLLGRSAKAASHELQRRGLRPYFTAIGDPSKGGWTGRCAGVPPGGHIVDTDSFPGAHARLGQRVALQTSCPPREELAACSLQDLRLRVYTNAFTTGGMAAPGFALTHFRGPTCVVTGSVELAIENSDGSLVEVPGNPSVTSLDEAAGPGETLGREGVWQQWCGASARHVLLVGRFATLTAERHVLAPAPASPGCSPYDYPASAFPTMLAAV